MPNRSLSFTHDSGGYSGQWSLLSFSFVYIPVSLFYCVLFCRFTCLDKRQENQKCLSVLRPRPPLAAWHPNWLPSPYRPIDLPWKAGSC